MAAWQLITTFLIPLLEVAKPSDKRSLYCQWHEVQTGGGLRAVQWTAPYQYSKLLVPNSCTISNGRPLHTGAVSRVLARGAPVALHCLEWNTVTCTKGKALVGTMSGHGSWVLSVDVSLDGVESSIGSSNRTVMLWDLGIRASVQTMKNHRDQAWAVAFRLPRGGNIQGGRVFKADVWLAFPTTTLCDYS